jgi:hypothetical protein
MEFEINQRQSRELLDEHIRFSYNFTRIGKYEWMAALIFFIVGLIIFLCIDPIRASGLIFMGIGLFELIKYPGRYKRWVNGKVKERIFNKDFQFIFTEEYFKLSYTDKERKQVDVKGERNDKQEDIDVERAYKYEDIKACLISNSGFVLKISFREYYYISFKSMDKKYDTSQFITFLKSRFDSKKLRTGLGFHSM